MMEPQSVISTTKMSCIVSICCSVLALSVQFWLSVLSPLMKTVRSELIKKSSDFNLKRNAGNVFHVIFALSKFIPQAGVYPLEAHMFDTPGLK